MAGEAAHMHFVDDSPRGGPVERRVAFPIVCTRINYHTLYRRRAIVALFSRSFATVVLRNNGAASIWVEEDFGRIEAHSTRRIEWPLNSIAVNLLRFDTVHEYVPMVIGAVRRGIDADHTRGSSVIGVIKEEQLDARCVL